MATQLQSAISQTKPLNIALVAPTGKAAQRLSESITNAVTGFKGQIADKVLAQLFQATRKPFTGY